MSHWNLGWSILHSLSANAKSHPVSAGGRHENAIAFLTELEDQLEVAQVQMETLSHSARENRRAWGGGVKRFKRYKADFLISLKSVFRALLHSRCLMLPLQLYQFYAEPFDLPSIKLFIPACL